MTPFSANPVQFHRNYTTPFLGVPSVQSSGSMPGVSTQGIKVLISRNRINMIESSEVSIKNIDTRTISEKLITIRSSFGLNTSDLANIFDVSRPTIYAWLDNNQEPKPETTSKLYNLVRLADEFKSLGLSRPDSLVKRPIFDGYSLLDKLINGNNIIDFFEQLKIIDQKEYSARMKKKTLLNQSQHSFEDIVSDATTLTLE
jgi:DNA-binding XRE family transcriptional regulator